MRSVLLALALTSTACANGGAGAYKTSYAIGATTTTFVNESHALYDEEANTALVGCNEKKDTGAITTVSQMDDCLGPLFKKSSQEKVVQVLGVYNVAATAFSAVMLGCEPNEDGTPVKASTCVKRTFTDDDLRAWRSELVSAAFDVLALFPEADAKIKKLEMLIGKR